jgi:hypothetical protein
MSDTPQAPKDDLVETPLPALASMWFLVRRLRREGLFDPAVVEQVHAQVALRHLWVLSADSLGNEHFACLLRGEIDALERELSIVAARRSLGGGGSDDGGVR